VRACEEHVNDGRSSRDQIMKGYMIMKISNATTIISTGSLTCTHPIGESGDMTDAAADLARGPADTPGSGRQEIQSSITIERFFDFQK
jgi:hypothetical protein